MASTAPLLVEYANRSSSPMSDAIEAMLRMTPPRPSILRTAARAQVDALDVHPQNALEIRLFGGQDGAHVRDTGVVDEDVDLPASRVDGGERLFDRACISDVASERDGICAESARLRGDGFGGRYGNVD